MDIKARIIKILTGIIGDIPQDLSDDASFEDYGFNSILFVRLIVLLEQEFDIEFPDEYLVYNKPTNLDKIMNIITELTQQAGSFLNENA